MGWLTHNPHGAFMARGVHGQTVYSDPSAEKVVVRYASHPVAGNAGNDATSLPAWQALAGHFVGHSRLTRGHRAPRRLSGFGSGPR